MIQTILYIYIYSFDCIQRPVYGFVVVRFHGTTVFILYINQATETAVVMSPS